MSNRHTGTYDAFLALTGLGLQRLTRSAMLEQRGEEGPPFLFDLQTVDDEGGVTGLSFFFDLPLLSLSGAGDLVIDLPFNDSALLTEDPKYCLAGTLTLVVPLLDEASRLTLDWANVAVFLVLSTTDPDPHDGDQTSAQKIHPLVVAGLASQIQDELREGQEELGELLTLDVLAPILDLPACPVEPSDLPNASSPVLAVPSAITSYDAEPRPGAPADPSDDLLLVKAKMSPRAEAMGTASEPDNADVSWVDGASDVEFLLSNRLLLDEILPAQLIPVLLTEQREALGELVAAEVESDDEFTESVEDAVRAEVSADSDFQDEIRERARKQVEKELQPSKRPGRGGGFADPPEAPTESELRRATQQRFLELWPQAVEDEVESRLPEALESARAQEVDRRLSTRWPEKVDEFFSFPMALLRPIPRRFPLPTLAQIVSGEFDEDDLEAPEEPNVRILDVGAVLVDSAAGQSVVRLTLVLDGSGDAYSFTGTFPVDLVFTHENGALTVVPSPGDATVDVHMGALYWILAVVGFLTPFLGGLVLGLIIAAVIDFVVDSIASGATGGMLEGQLGSADVELAGLDGVMVVRRVVLDDLTVGGRFRIGHDGPESSDRAGVVVERDSIRDEGSGRARLEEGALTVTLEREGGDLEFEGLNLLPLGQTRLADLGFQPTAQARALGQADLWDEALDYGSGPIDLRPPDLLLDQSGHQVVGVITESGRRGLVLIQLDPLGLPRVSWRLYHRSLRGLRLLPRGSFQGKLGVQSTTSCETTSVVSDRVGVPVLVGPGIVDMGSLEVGVVQKECRYDASVTLLGSRLREPVSDVTWTVVLEDGSEHQVAPGADVIVDVDPGSDSVPVTFRIDDATPVAPAAYVGIERVLGACRATTRAGDSGFFRLRARLTEKHDQVLEAELPVSFDGRRTNAFGFERWLDQFEKVLAILHGELVPGDGVTDPPPEDFSGIGGPSVRPSHGGRVLVSPRDYHRADPNGTLGLRAAELSKPRGSRSHPEEIYSLEAKRFLARRVEEGFAELEKAGAEPRVLRELRARLEAHLGKLPEPGEMLERGECGGPQRSA